MTSFPVMLFLITLPLSSILTEGRVLPQKQSLTPAEHTRNVKTVLDKIDCQDKENDIEALKGLFCVSHQDETSIDDMIDANQNNSYLSTVLTAVRKLCTNKHQEDPVNSHNMANKAAGTRVDQQQEYFTCKVIFPLDDFIEIVANVLVSH
ncbi:exocrine gland-secreted peptide 1-like [Microtus ochrogaster]|uniref:Exocrine gland-secreted peptide 1-like n=1 Tax=Microtus ochrogaster TaxID=79684 RepID=A0ABM1AQK7_MICOH|nr:exocrine gland-secreted peptide 1-like [Microtus ochrogaster]